MDTTETVLERPIISEEQKRLELYQVLNILYYLTKTEEKSNETTLR